MNEIIGITAICIGMLFNMLGCVGLVRLPDLYTRMQATTKCVTMGTSMLCIGIAVMAWDSSIHVALKALMCMIAVLVTSPTAAHALARSAHKSGIPLWDKSVVNQWDDKPAEPPRAEGGTK